MSAHQRHNHRPLKHPRPNWVEKDPSKVPLEIQIALISAIQLEGVPMADFDDLLWIMAQETEGKIGKNSSLSSARGLFQLLRDQYNLNPHGESSFGNAIEECQGGIRYIYGRYHTADAAKKFWMRNHWY